MRKRKRRFLHQCSYCGDEISTEPTYRYEKVDGIRAYYHIDCYGCAVREGQTLMHLFGKDVSYAI